DVVAVEGRVHLRSGQVEVAPGTRLGPAHERGAATVVQARAVVAARAVPVAEHGVADLERGEQAVDAGPGVRLGVRLVPRREVPGQPGGELAPAAPVVAEQPGA